MLLLTINNRAAAFATIADGLAFRGNDFFKISSAHLMNLKAFRAAVVSQLIFGNDKMAVPALQLVAFNRYQP